MEEQMPKRATPEPEGKRIPLMVRTTKELRQVLEDAAASSGRSLSQEVEFRLGMIAEWERAYGVSKQVISEALDEADYLRQQAVQAGFESLRKKLDFRYAHLPNGGRVLLEPGQVAQLGDRINDPDQVLAYLGGQGRVGAHDIEQMVERGIERGLAKLLAKYELQPK
jgi:uncharacterized protein (DUF1778 family)